MAREPDGWATRFVVVAVTTTWTASLLIGAYTSEWQALLVITPLEAAVVGWVTGVRIWRERNGR